MAKKIKGYKPPSCAFCSNPSNTKEHHWPQWLDEVLPARTPHDKSINFKGGVKKLGDVNYSINPRLLIKQGAPHRVGRRSVCVACNTGWMSQIQNKAKPILIELILGTKKVLTFEEQMLICPWMIMTDMTAEYTDPATMTTSKEQRSDFKNSKLPPTGWLVFAGRYKGDQWKTRFNHKALQTKRDGPYDIHTTLFVVGEFFFTVFAVYENSFEPMDEFLSEFVKAFPLIRIWPKTKADIVWSELAFLSDSDANDLAGFMVLNQEPAKFEVNPYHWV